MRDGPLDKLQIEVLAMTQPEIYKIFVLVLREIAALRERVKALEAAR